METLKVKSGQSLLDMAVEHSGGMEGAFPLAEVNGISLTDDLSVGDRLEPSPVVDERTALLFGNMVHKPATALTEDDFDLDDDIEIFDDTFDVTFE